MDPAELAAKFGGQEAGSSTQPSATPSATTTTAPVTPTATPDQLATNFGGEEAGGAKTGNKSFLDTIGDFFTGNTQQFGKDSGEALVAPHNAELFNQAVEQHNAITNDLLSAIKKKKAAGQDASSLEGVLHQHIDSTPKIQDFTGEVIDKTPEQILGEAGGTLLEALSGGALEAPGALVDESLTTAQKLAKGARIGAGFGAAGGASEAMKNNESVGDVTKNALESGALGAGVGGGFTAAGVGLSKIAQWLPTRIVQSVMPELDQKTGQYFLKNAKFGTMKSMIDDSLVARNSLGTQIKNVLAHPEYEAHQVDGDAIVNNVLTGFTDRNGVKVPGFENSNYDKAAILNTTKRVVPEVAKIIDNLGNGTATLQELNTARTAIDQATKKIFTDTPQVSSAKKLAAGLASSIRDYVQTTAPETQPMFKYLQKEINLGRLLSAIKKKMDSKSGVGFGDLLFGMTGGHAGGIPGALEAVAGERIARHPLVRLGAAKLISNGSDFVIPLVKKTLKAATRQISP